MNKIARAALRAFLGVSIVLTAPASMVLPASTERKIEISAAVFRGIVVGRDSYVNTNDGGIYTRTVVRVAEVFKGTLPPLVELVHRGGVVGDRGEMDDASPRFKLNEERLLYVSRRADGTVYAVDGDAGALPLSGAPAGELIAVQSELDTLRAKASAGPLPGGDFTVQTSAAATPNPPDSGNPVPLVNPVSNATNLLVGAGNIGARFIQPDRGEPIPYYIDADYLPTGITLTQAVNAVQTALAAWTNVTSVRYAFAGFQSFGMNAQAASSPGGTLRIQLHDHYNFIGGGGGSGDTLGVGGQGWTTTTLSVGWTTGGNVAGNDFHRVNYGYIVLAHTNAFMRNVTNFTEVLTHEIGHTIGCGHSSQNSGESNPILRQAIMFYAAHGDGRGATLNSYDINVSRQMHPAGNTPPYNYDRVLDVVTAPGVISAPGVNSAEVRGYDLQNDALTFATADGTANSGSFSVSGKTITFTPSGYFSGAQADPAGTAYYDRIFARYSDGVNASAISTIRVISFNPDGYSEGIPDAWRTTYFGNANPGSGLKHHANDDADGDGFSNLQEYLLGSNPTDPGSNLRITSFSPANLQWQAKPYEVYELYSTTNVSTPMANWTRAANPIVPVSAPGVATNFANGGPRRFFRVQKAP